MDDKAARLEAELERLARRSENAKFILTFAASIAGLSVASLHVPAYAFAAIFPLVVVFVVALAFHWDFPEIVHPLMKLIDWVMRRDEPPSPGEDEE